MDTTEKTFREISAFWLNAKRPLVRHSTLCAYLLSLRTHLLPHFGGATSISESDVQQFVLSKCSSGLSTKTVRDIVAVLRSVVKYADKWKMFKAEEWDVRNPAPQAKSSRPRVLTMSDQRKLMRHLRERPTAHNMGILLALCTGMRIGEVCALKWDDVDLAQKTITVRHTVGRVYNCELKATERVQSSPKTKNSCRELPISRQLHEALRTLRSRSRSPYVVGSGTRPSEPRSLREHHNRLLRSLGIGHIVFHGLRHTFATRCVESQCDYKTISAILGHANVATTLNLYVHPDISQKRRCVERMSRFVETPTRKIATFADGEQNRLPTP